MAKKLLSLLLSCALLLTCFSGIALISVTAEAQDEPYLWLQVSEDGQLSGNYSMIRNNSADGFVEPTIAEIPDVGGYGIKLATTDFWHRLDIGFDATAIAGAEGMQLVMEYYIDADFAADANEPVLMFWNGNGAYFDQPNYFTNSFVSKEVATFTYTYSAADIATIAARGNAADIRFFPHDVAKKGMYIKSLKLVEPSTDEPEDPPVDEPGEEQGPYMWFEVDDNGELSGKYLSIKNNTASGFVEPTIAEIPDVGGYGIKLATTDYWHRLDIEFDSSALPTDGRSVTLVMEYYITSNFGPDDGAWRVLGLDNGNGVVPDPGNLLAESFENKKVATFTYTYTAADIETIRQKGTTKIRLFPDAVARMGMYIKSIHLVEVADKTNLQAYVEKTAEFTQYKTPASVAEYNKAVEAAQLVLDDEMATQKMIDKALADLEAARALLVDCPHNCGTTNVGYVEETCTEDGYSGDNVCNDCGFLSEENKGEVIPRHETTIKNKREPSCSEKGYSGDLWCVKCNVLLREGIYKTELPHSWDEGKVTKPATKEERGEITKTCVNCSATEIFYFAFVAEKGDVNGDGKTNSTDARMTLQFSVGKIAGDALDIAMADVNGDNKINSSDARLILQFSVGKITMFPVA